MGDVFAETTVQGPRGEIATLRLLVDTGSSYTWIPAAVAKELGLKPVAVIPFELANGRSVRHPVAEAKITILGRTATRWVVFGGPRDAGLVGTDTLQGLLLVVDPSAHRLRPRRGAMAVSPRVVNWGRRPRARRAASPTSAARG